MFPSPHISTSGPSRPPTMSQIPSKEPTMITPSPVTQTVPDVVLPVLPSATYAAYHEIRTTPNSLDNFFGGGSSETQRPLPHARTTMPPPYAPYGHEVVELERGVYSVKEPVTLARMLFFYGFLFFPFWIVGIYILFSPLRPTSDWEAGKTEDEKTQLLQILRETEKKWARRCLYAMLSLIAIVTLLVIIVQYGILANI